MEAENLQSAQAHVTAEEPTTADAGRLPPSSDPTPAAPAEPIRRIPRDADRKTRNAERMRLARLEKRLAAKKREDRVAGVEPREEAPTPAPVVALAPPPDPRNERRGPGWPTNGEIADNMQLAVSIWAKAAPMLEGSRYAIGEKRKVNVGGVEIEVDPQAQLAEATAPLLAKYVADSAKSPEASAALAVFVVFGMPALAHGGELFVRYLERQKLKAAA